MRGEEREKERERERERYRESLTCGFIVAAGVARFSALIACGQGQSPDLGQGTLSHKIW